MSEVCSHFQKHKHLRNVRGSTQGPLCEGQSELIWRENRMSGSHIVIFVFWPNNSTGKITIRLDIFLKGFQFYFLASIKLPCMIQLMADNPCLPTAPLAQWAQCIWTPVSQQWGIALKNSNGPPDTLRPYNFPATLIIGLIPFCLRGLLNMHSFFHPAVFFFSKTFEHCFCTVVFEPWTFLPLWAFSPTVSLTLELTRQQGGIFGLMVIKRK